MKSKQLVIPDIHMEVETALWTIAQTKIDSSIMRPPDIHPVIEALIITPQVRKRYACINYHFSHN